MVKNILMSKYIYIIFFSCFSLKVSVQLPPVGTTWISNNISTPFMQAIYKNDVLKLAMSRMEDTDSPLRDSLFVPVIIADSIANSLYAIHNMPNSVLKDTIMNLFGFSNFSATNKYEKDSLHIIHTEKGVTNAYLLDKIDVTAPSTAMWAQNWRSGNFTNTPNAEINYLGSLPYLNKNIQTGSGIYFIVINSNIKINTLGLTHRFKRIINNSNASQPYNYTGDGNSLKIYYENDGMKLIYRNGCGDCPAGCTHGRFWKFKIFYSNFTVQYLGDSSFNIYNNPIPDLSCLRENLYPVHLLSFTAKLQGKHTHLNWTVEAEQSFDRYEVERSSNGKDFSKIGSLKAVNAKEYNYTDIASLDKPSPLETAGVRSFYRLKMLDKDSKFTYSKIVSVKLSSVNSFIIVPNPATSNFQLLMDKTITGNVSMHITDMAGKVLFQKVYDVTGSTINISTGKLIGGIYIVKLQYNGETYFQHLIVAKD